MALAQLQEANELLDKAAADLQPELVDSASARRLLAESVQVRRKAEYLIATLTHKVHDPEEVAKVTGTSVGQAKATVATGEVLRGSAELSEALAHGEVSLEQATEIAKAEGSVPGAAEDLVRVAREESFAVLKERARKVKLEAEQHRGLGQRQKEARTARSYNDDLGMVHLHMALQPHVGTPIVNRAEAEAQRRYRAAKTAGEEPFERYLADAYAAMLAGSTVNGSSTRPELVLLVSYEVAKRGWVDVREGEFCKIPGVGPVPAEVAGVIAQDAFLNGVLFDGTDLRHFKRWSRNIPVEVNLALNLGSPPEFDGVKCMDCGSRFRPERDHLEPHVAKGPASTTNLGWRCGCHHKDKTKEDRKNGRLKPPDPDEEPPEP